MNNNSPIEPEIVENIPDNTSKKKKDHKKLLSWIWLILAVVYTVSPVDLISDIIPAAGFADDLFIFGAAVTNFIQQNFLQGKDTLNKIFKILKRIFISLAILTALLFILIITVIVKN